MKEKLTIQRLEDGRFLDDAEDEFERLQAVMVAHIRRYGEKAEKAKATMVIKIDFVPDESKGGVSVRTSLETKVPGRPKGEMLAFPEGSRLVTEQLELFDSGGVKSA